MLRKIKQYRSAILNAIIAVLIFIITAFIYRTYYNPYAYPGLIERALLILGVLFIAFIVMYVNFGRLQRMLEAKAQVRKKHYVLLYNIIMYLRGEKGYVLLLALAGMIYVFIRIREIGFISYIVTALTGLLMISASMIVLGEEDEKL